MNKRLVRELLLPAWFAAMSAFHLTTPTLAKSDILGVDARIYYRGAASWLHGMDPWSAYATAGTSRLHFAGSPPTIQLFTPAALLPEAAFVAIWLCVTTAAAVYVLWRLRLPGTWLLFPPITEALISGNPQVIVLALLVARTPASEAMSVLLKVYAAIPILGERRWRAGAVTLGLLAISVVTAPRLWISYLSEFGAINARLVNESGGGYSAWGLPFATVALVVVALSVLAIFDRRAAVWLITPAIWPASQIHYSTFALPVITEPLAFVLAIPQRGIPSIAVVGFAAWHLFRYALRRRLQ